MYTFELPEIGEGVVEGEIVQWLVKPGDLVAVDQPVCEIMTDKATVEISTPVGGRIMTLTGEPGDVIKVHAPLAEIDQDGGGAPAAPKAPAPAPKAAAPAPKAAAPAPAPKAAAPAAPAPVAASGKAVATPAVRRRARELDIDLGAVAGSGKRGRVLHADLDTHNAPAPAPVRAPALPQANVVPSGQEEHVKIIGLRRKIAEQMVRSVQSAPHFTYVDEVDMTKLWGIRKQLKGRAADQGVKLTFLPFFIKALTLVFREFPNLNANVIEDPLTLVVKGDVNIGIATDTPNGLFVPVVKNCEQKSILRIAADIADLTQRTRDGQATKDELGGGTFTITSVGNIGGMFATPIINHPQVAILGINKIHERPVVRDGQVVVRRMLYLSSSFDHRIIDGAVAARFTTALKQRLEQPESLLLEMI
jgi:pyruvate dehydrogenase E2 component (dihydrolipoamide acetyltransferase)